MEDGLDRVEEQMRQRTQQIAMLNQTLMHGSLPSDASNIILAATNSIASASTDPLAAVRAASYLILTSAQYQVER